MQIQVGDVGPELPGAGDANERVEVGAVEIHLTAVVVDYPADLFDGLFEHSMSGRIGDHHRGQSLTMEFGFGGQVCDIDVAPFVTGDDHHLHACHHRRGGVGAVSRGRYEANHPLALTPAAVIGADRQQARQLALRAGVRLERNAVVPRDLDQVPLQAFDELRVSAEPGREAQRDGSWRSPPR